MTGEAVRRAATVASIFVAFRRPPGKPELALYERGLVEVPAALLDAAAARAIRTRRFLPTVAELLDDAETCRQERLAGQPWAPCELCEESNGWVSRADDQGVERLSRCACWMAHQEHLKQDGLAKPLALPAPERHGDE